LIRTVVAAFVSKPCPLATGRQKINLPLILGNSEVGTDLSVEKLLVTRIRLLNASDTQPFDDRVIREVVLEFRHNKSGWRSGNLSGITQLDRRNCQRQHFHPAQSNRTLH
jgi:hypothetical protein